MCRVPVLVLVLTVACAVLSACPGGAYAQDKADGTKPAAKSEAQGAPSTTPRGLPQGVIDDLGNWRVWVVLLVALVSGWLGSLAYELAEALTSKPAAVPGDSGDPTIPTPDAGGPPPRATFGGLLSRVLLGGFAAVAVLYPLRPDGLIGLIGLSVIAGSMGAALFKALHERVLLLAKTAQLSAAVAADRAVFRNIRQQAQEGAAQAAAAAQDGRPPDARKLAAAGAVALPVIAALAEAGLRTSEGVLAPGGARPPGGEGS